MPKLRLLILLAAFGFAAGAAAQTAPSPDETIDLLDLMGVKLPQGEALAKLIGEAKRHPLGSKLNPVRAAGPDGQRAYLARLRCLDGSTPSFERAFNAGIGPFGRIIDSYNVACGGERREVYLDMYHPRHVESLPIDGFSIVPAPPPPIT